MMTSLQAINKVALLFMAVFLTGMIAIYQLRFEHREESYGISLAYGAQYKELYWEIFCEILLLVQWLFAQYVIKRVEKGND